MRKPEREAAEKAAQEAAEAAARAAAAAERAGEQRRRRREQRGSTAQSTPAAARPTATTTITWPRCKRRLQLLTSIVHYQPAARSRTKEPLLLCFREPTTDIWRQYSGRSWRWRLQDLDPRCRLREVCA